MLGSNTSVTAKNNESAGLIVLGAGGTTNFSTSAPVKKLTIQNGEVFAGEVSARFTDAKPFAFLPGQPPAR
jgi:hypothetical protein